MVRPTLRLSQSLRPRRAPQSHPRQVRFSSTNPNTEAAQKKAQDALASAQKYAGQAAESAQKFLGPVGDKAASFLGGTSSAYASIFGTDSQYPIRVIFDPQLCLNIYSLPGASGVQLPSCTRIPETGVCC
jgi:hypothetical protein